MPYKADAPVPGVGRSCSGVKAEKRLFSMIFCLEGHGFSFFPISNTVKTKTIK